MTESEACPEAIVQKIRRYWSIPKGPVYNTIETLEDNGFYVIEFSFGAESIDAFTLKEGSSMPIIFLNKDFPMDRKR